MSQGCLRCGCLLIWTTNILFTQSKLWFSLIFPGCLVTLWAAGVSLRSKKKAEFPDVWTPEVGRQKTLASHFTSPGQLSLLSVTVWFPSAVRYEDQVETDDTHQVNCACLMLNDPFIKRGFSQTFICQCHDIRYSPEDYCVKNDSRYLYKFSLFLLGDGKRVRVTINIASKDFALYATNHQGNN